MVRANIRQFNPKAVVLETTMPVTVDLPHLIKGKRVLVVEDGPTLTHGGMSFGAGVLAAKQQGARELVDPRAYAVGTIQQTFIQYPHIGPVLPALGYGATQIRELEDTINRVPCDVVLIATPVDLGRIISIKHPTCRVVYSLEEPGTSGLRDACRASFSKQERDESFSNSVVSHRLREGELNERNSEDKNESSQEAGTRLLPSMRRDNGVRALF